MSAIGRAFVAVVPPEPVRDAIEVQLGRATFAGWRRPRREQWHLTLEFLGRVDDADDEIARLATIVGGLRPFEVRLGGAGAFPDVDRAGVVWLGVVEGERDLGGLATLVRRLDVEPFHPHLTVARANRTRDARSLVDSLAATSIGPAWTVEAVELIASDTHPSGARYTTVAELALGGRTATR